MSITFAQGRAAVAHLRDQLELTNRDLARVFQDHIAPDDFVSWMTGDDQAITPEQSQYIGNELAQHIEQAKLLGADPSPEFLKAMGMKQ